MEESRRILYIQPGMFVKCNNNDAAAAVAAAAAAVDDDDNDADDPPWNCSGLDWPF